MSRVRVLHPEFGYAGTSHLFRPFMVFVACGLVAGAIGFAIFDSGPDADPMDAMALAPPKALIASKLVHPATQELDNRSSAQKSDEQRAQASGTPGSPVRVVRMRPPRAANERPFIAAVPIGHRDDPTMIPEEPKATAASTQLSVVNEMPSDVAAAAEPTPPAPMPTVTDKKSRPGAHHASRRNHSYGSSYGARISRYGASGRYVQFGYARLW